MTKARTTSPAWLPPLGLFMLALVVRLFRIGQESFFFDEVMTHKACLGGVWDHIRRIEVTPPLYFWLIDGWSKAFGTGHVALRTFSALVGAAGAPLVYLTLRRLVPCVAGAGGDVRAGGDGRGTAIAGSVLFGLSPVAVWYGQQARAYALLMTLVAAWIWLVVRSYEISRGRNATGPGNEERTKGGGKAGTNTDEHGQTRTDTDGSPPGVSGHFPSLLLALVVFAGFSVHYYFVFPIVGGLATLGVFFVLHREGWARWRDVLLPQAIGVAGWLVYLPLVRAQAVAGNLGWQPRPTLAQLSQVYTEVFVSGPFVTAPGWARAIAGLVLVAVAVGAAIAWFGEEGLPPGESSEKSTALPRHERRLWIAFLFAVAVTPVLLPFLISLGPKSIFLKDRYTVAAFPAFLLFLLFVLDSGPARRLRGLPAVAVAALLLIPAVRGDVLYWREFQDFDWRGAARIIQADARPGDALVFIPGWMQNTFQDNGGTWAGVTITGDYEKKIDEWGRSAAKSHLPDSGIQPPNEILDQEYSNKGIGEAPHLWLFAWEGTPSPEEQAVGKRLAGAKEARVRVDFPHIHLWEIPLPAAGEASAPE